MKKQRKTTKVLVEMIENKKLAMKADLDKIDAEGYTNFQLEFAYFDLDAYDVFFESYGEVFEKTSDVIVTAFAWANSIKGSSYWIDVKTGLVELGL